MAETKPTGQVQDEVARRPRREWGSGGVYQRRSDNRWIAAVRADGKRHVRYAWTEAEAKRELRKLRQEVAGGRRPADRRVTVGKVLVDWLETRRGVVQDISYVRYELIVRMQLAPLAKSRLRDLGPEDVRRFMRGLEVKGLSGSTREQALRILRSALDLAVSDGLVPRNVARGHGITAPPRDKGAGRALDAAELRAFMTHARKDPLWPLWAVLVGTGIRKGEALALLWSDIDRDTRTLTVAAGLHSESRRTRGGKPRLQRVDPKTDAGRRTVVIPGFAWAALETLDRDATAVFHRSHGRYLNPSTVDRAWAALLEKARAENEEAPEERLQGTLRIHDLRHTAATLMIASGASLDDVKRQLGHTSIAITSDVYGHLVAGRARELADALDRAIAG